MLYFNAKIGKEDIFTPTVEKKSLQEISNEQGPDFDDLKIFKK
jgi:hypothetical protein